MPFGAWEREEGRRERKGGRKEKEGGEGRKKGGEGRKERGEGRPRVGRWETRPPFPPPHIYITIDTCHGVMGPDTVILCVA